MPGAVIVADQPTGAGPGTAGNARDDLWYGQAVDLSCSVGGNTSYSWSLVTVPSGSGASLSTPTSATSSFTPDVVGSYIVQLVTNGGGPGNAQRRVLRVRYDNTGALANRGWAYPAHNEVETDSTGIIPAGWDGPIEFVLEDVRLNAFGGGAGGAGALWSGTHPYSQGDLVTLYNIIYICLSPVTGGFPPPSNPGNWRAVTVPPNYQLVYQPGGTPSVSVFTSWSSLITAAHLLPAGAVTIYIDTTYGTPHIDTFIDFGSRLYFVGNGGAYALVDAGVSIAGLKLLSGVTLICDTSIGHCVVPSADLGFLDLELTDGAVILSTNGAHEAINGLNANIKLKGGSMLGDGVLAAIACASTSFQVSEGASILSNALSGSPPQVFINDINSTYSFTQPGLSGPATISGPSIESISFRLANPYDGVTPLPGNFDGPVRIKGRFIITDIILTRRTAGSSGSTRVDVQRTRAGTEVSLYNVDADKPIIAFGSGNWQSVSAPPTLTNGNILQDGDIISPSLELVEGHLNGPPPGPEGLELLIQGYRTR